MTEPTDSAAGRWIAHRGPWLLFGCAVAILLVGAWLRRHTLDDAFINYRIVNQLQAGNGPVFNVGERVEAFTSPLWLVLLAIGDWVLPVRLEWIGMGGGILLGAAGLIFAGLGAHSLHRIEGSTSDRRTVLLPLGALITAAFPPIYRLIATGLEDGVTMAWIGAVLWVLARWSRSEGPLRPVAAVLVGLGVLVRPDLAPFVGVLIVAVLVGDRASGWRRNAGTVCAAAAVPVASEVLRMGYFGLLTPNTAIAKSASLSRWATGWHYLTDTILPYGFWVPLVVLLVVGYVPLFSRSTGSSHERRRMLVAAAFLVGSLLSALYIVRVGGDYMQTRLLLPALFGFLAPVTFVAWPRTARSTPALVTRAGLVAAGVIWIVVCGLFVRTPSDTRAVLFEPENAVTLDDFAATFPGPIKLETRPGRVYYIGTELPYAGSRGATPIVIEFGVGKVAYALDDDVYVFDVLGLANPIAAHEALRLRSWPGHEKLLTQPWIAALTTAPGSDPAASSFPVPPPLKGEDVVITFPDQGDARGRPFDERVATARGVMSCATMRRFEKSYAAPMTARRFASNLTGSFRNQRLVIPGEPADAAAALCTPAERAAITALTAGG